MNIPQSNMNGQIDAKGYNHINIASREKKQRQAMLLRM